MLLVSVVISSVLLASTPGTVGDVIRREICRVQGSVHGVDGTDCGQRTDRAEEPAEHDFDPEYCVRDGHTETVGGTVEFGVFSLGSEYKYMKQTLSDGTVVVTMKPSAEVSRDVKGGGGVDTGKDSLKKEVGAGFKAFVAPGTTYFLEGEEPGETGEEQFQRLKEDIEQARREEQQDMWGAGQGYQMGRAIGEITGHYEPPDLPDPDIKSGTFGFKFNADGPITQWAENNKNKKGPLKQGEKIGLTSGDDWNVEVDENIEIARWYDDPNNTKTARTYTFDASGDAVLKRMGAKWGPGASLNGATRVMRNEDGSLRNIRYSVTVSGNSKLGLEENPRLRSGNGNTTKGSGAQENTQSLSSTQEIQLDFETPQEQEVGEQLLEEGGLMPPASTMSSLLNPLPEDGGSITEKPGEDAPEWERLFYDKGRVWQYISRSSKSEQEYGGSLKAGISFGASFGWSEETQRSIHAQILEGPEGGEREFVRHEPCIASEYRDTE
ncbi:hypothetical protein EFW17_19340 [Halostreptopolyspora alba]|uniref:Uncharacterized protein n=1 Tax=Halostreptopolyspora alba TaxID=2487137 RepID=A0A3N0E3U0_9ACTN|nr:hypothetical protein EFW17_19340 [Nocardiopsaceae bacterium YIM 96095]